jgi:hypothetical protein
LNEVEGHVEWEWKPQNYMVQADLGEVTGAQASIYTRAKAAIDQALPLLDGLTPLREDADPEDCEAIRALVRSELKDHQQAWSEECLEICDKSDALVVDRAIAPPVVESFVPPFIRLSESLQLLVRGQNVQSKAQVRLCARELKEPLKDESPRILGTSAVLAKFSLKELGAICCGLDRQSAIGRRSHGQNRRYA